MPLAAIAAAATVALAMAGCGSSGSGATSNATIVICGDLALTGPYAQIGQTDNYGATAFFKHVNATGGILGHKVKYIENNNQSSAAQSELIARKCILQQHAKFIVGPESGADTEAALPIAISYKTILISLSSGWQTNGYPASELNSWGFPGFYDVFYNDQLASVQQLIVPRHYTRVALLEDNCGSVCLANKGSVEALAKQYGFSNNTAYAYYRLNVTANNGDASGIQLAEMSFASLPAVSITPPRLNLAITNGSIRLSWPPDHIGWRLETNSVLGDPGTSWTTLSGSTQTNLVVVPGDTITRGAFFRLAYP